MIKEDHPHSDPGDGRAECGRCGKWIWPAIHSCKGVPVTAAAARRLGMTEEQIRRVGIDPELAS